MKRRVFRALAGLALLGLAGCAAAPQTAETLTLEGILVLKGSGPAMVPALMVGDSELWELQNVSLATAKRLQNKRIEVTGLVTRASAIGVQLPSLRVTNLRPR